MAVWNSAVLKLLAILRTCGSLLLTGAAVNSSLTLRVDGPFSPLKLQPQTLIVNILALPLYRVVARALAESSAEAAHALAVGASGLAQLAGQFTPAYQASAPRRSAY